MSTVDELIKQPYARVLTPDETGGYVADVLEIPDCFSEGNTADEAIENLEDAMRTWFEIALEQGRPIPVPLEAGEFNGRILLRTPKWVHRECVRRAELDGVSLNQWLLQAVSERLGAEGFVDRLMSKLNGLVNVAAFEERSVTTMKVSRLLLGAQEEIGGPIQLVEPDGKQLLNWTSIDVKEAQRA